MKLSLLLGAPTPELMLSPMAPLAGLVAVVGGVAAHASPKTLKGKGGLEIFAIGTLSRPALKEIGHRIYSRVDVSATLDTTDRNLLTL